MAPQAGQGYKGSLFAPERRGGGTGDGGAKEPGLVLTPRILRSNATGTAGLTANLGEDADEPEHRAARAIAVAACIRGKATGRR